MGKYFGTDGMRGEANKDLNIDLVVNLGLAIGRYLQLNTRDTSKKPLIVLGTDTRISGYMIRSALSTGITAMGVNIKFVGVIPTPGVSYLTRYLDADFGIMISASHNPIKDNGIKIFSNNGEKISDVVEKELEDFMDKRDEILKYSVSGDNTGRFTFTEEDVEQYRRFLKKTVKTSFKGYKVVIDAANGAAYRVAAKVFQSLGADVIVINNIPNGRNINVNCGSTNTKILREVVKIYNANIGLAFDGDADRLIAVDENGNEIDGDQIIGLIAVYMKKNNLLNDNTVVTTVQSNMGFEKYLKKHNIKLIRANVGDKNVLEKMRLNALNVGGEQSGHIVLTDYNTTGDGILAGLQLFSLLITSKKTLSELVSEIKLWPQKMVNIKLDNKEQSKILDDSNFKERIEQEISKIRKYGRVLIRPSGTEPLIRIMVEAEDENKVDEYLEKLVNIVKEYI